MELRREPCALRESYSYSAQGSRRNSTRPRPTTTYAPRQNTACSRTRSYSPDDGHNDARNMVRSMFNNKHRISCILLVPSLHLIFTMHGHKNLKLLVLGFNRLSTSLNDLRKLKNRREFHVFLKVTGRLQFRTVSNRSHLVRRMCNVFTKRIYADVV